MTFGSLKISQAGKKSLNNFRILVGLRWWSHIKEDGEEEWIFESLPEPEKKASTVDSTVFWISSYGVPAVWVILAVVSLINLSINSFFICLIGVGLGAVNLLGYIKCQKNHKMAV